MNDLKVEKQEAINAGLRALNTLRSIQDELNSARNWGILDILGGGSFTSFIKHTKISKASTLCYQARRDIEDFERELKDVLFLTNDLDINIGSLLTFLDFFSDDAFSDYLVQREINNARNRIDDAIRTITSIIENIQNSL